MPKPNIQTSPNAIVSILQGVPDWFSSHQEALSVELEEGEDIPGDAARLSETLEQAEGAFNREVKETKAAYTAMSDQVSQVPAFERSVRASVERRLNKNNSLTPAARRRILADFRLGPPSAVRTVKSAKNRLDELNSALDVHGASIGTPSRVEGWLQTIESSRKKLDTAAIAIGREKQESGDAFEAREAARADAVAFIDDITLASEAVEINDPRVIENLRILFDLHNPSPGGGSSPGEPLPDTDDI
ncbi:MAG: hypothetical protein AAFS10_16885 [Myxococcota bacterium]